MVSKKENQLYRTKWNIAGVFALLILGSLFCPRLVYGEKIGTITDVTNPYIMDVSQNRLYVVDGINIAIYSLDTLKLEKKIGKRGEGPQEFFVPPQTNMGNVSLDVYDDFITVTSVGKLSYFSKAGEYIKEIKAGHPWPNLKPIGEHFVGRGSAVENGINFNTVRLYNSGMNPQADFIRVKSWITVGQAVNPFFLPGPMFYVFDNKIYVEKDKDAIAVFDQAGQLLTTLDINQHYDKPAVTSQEKEKWLDFFKGEPPFKELFPGIKRDLKLPDLYPGIRFFFAPDRELCIFRWTGEPGKLEVALFDLTGRFIKKAQVAIFMKNIIAPEALAISNHKIYQLVENEETEGQWDLHVMEIK